MMRPTKRRVRHLAGQQGLPPDEALQILKGASFPVASINDLVAAYRVDAAIAVLRAHSDPVSQRPQESQVRSVSEPPALPSNPLPRAGDLFQRTKDHAKAEAPPRRGSAPSARQDGV